MIVCVMICVGRCRLDAVERRSWLGLGGVGTVLASGIAAYGVCSGFGTHTSLSFFLVKLLSPAVGAYTVDDPDYARFVASDCWDRIVEIRSRAFNHAQRLQSKSAGGAYEAGVSGGIGWRRGKTRNYLLTATHAAVLTRQGMHTLQPGRSIAHVPLATRREMARVDGLSLRRALCELFSEFLCGAPG